MNADEVSRSHLVRGTPLPLVKDSMTPYIMNWFTPLAPPIKGRVLEVGSYDVNGSVRGLVDVFRFLEDAVSLVFLEGYEVLHSTVLRGDLGDATLACMGRKPS